MNSVSWFLYLIDVSGNVSGFFVALGILAIVSVGGIIIAGIILRDELNNQSDNTCREAGVKLHKKAPYVFALGIFFLLLCSLIPSKDTLYMIGASQIGEQIIALEEVQEVGGEVGGLAKDTIALLREKIQSSLSETDK